MTDIILDDGDIDRIRLQAGAVKMESADLILDHPSRRKTRKGMRRALVHDQNDGLTINFNGDYPGGVTIVGLKLPEADKPDNNIKVLWQGMDDPKLPKHGTIGELVVVVRSTNPLYGGKGPLMDSNEYVTLWICSETEREDFQLQTIAYWTNIPLGNDYVKGSV